MGGLRDKWIKCVSILNRRDEQLVVLIYETALQSSGQRQKTHRVELSKILNCVYLTIRDILIGHTYIATQATRTHHSELSGNQSMLPNTVLTKQGANI